MGLDAESKAFVFDALTQPVDIAAIDMDHPAERAYLQALGHRLNLPADLIAHLDHQVEDASSA